MARLTAQSVGAKQMQIRRQIVDITENIMDMQATYVRLGERSNWKDKRLVAWDWEIGFWEDRVAQLRRELRTLERMQAAQETPPTPQPAA